MNARELARAAIIAEREAIIALVVGIVDEQPSLWPRRRELVRAIQAREGSEEALVRELLASMPLLPRTAEER